MFGLKRLVPSGFVVSAIVHCGILLLALGLIGANTSKPMAPTAIPPNAMLVDIVPPPDETPRLEGTPADATTSGSRSPGNSNSASAQPPAKPASQQPRQPPPSSEQRDAPEAEAPSETPTPPQPDSPEAVARLALLGGRLGGGFEAPAIDAPEVAPNFADQFLERVSSCSALPAGVNVGDKVSVRLRVSLNLDGTLASLPQLNETSASPKQQALMQSAIDALRRCQPYTMLPADKYEKWRTLYLTISPLSFPRR